MIDREICRHETLERITPTDDCTVHSLEKPLPSVNPFLFSRKTPELLALRMVSDGDIRKPKPSQAKEFEMVKKLAKAPEWFCGDCKHLFRSKFGLPFCRRRKRLKQLLVPPRCPRCGSRNVGRLTY